jgi:hypothetical protein
MLLRKTCYLALFFCIGFTPSLRAQVQNNLPEEVNTSGMERGLARVLDRYYEASFGGFENWQTIETIRFEGMSYRDGVSMRFIGLKKKPNLIKLTLFLDDDVRVIMSYDGSDAWSMTRGKRPTPPVQMDEDRARAFIADAPFGGNLLFPQQEGKEIKLTGSRIVDGDSCYEIEVTLADGRRSTHLIDAEKFVERRTIRWDDKNGVKQTMTHSNFEMIDGVLFALKTESEVDGEMVRSLVIEEVNTNLGIPSWAFERPKN